MNKLEQVFKMYNKEENNLFPLRKYNFCPQCGNKFLQSDFSEQHTLVKCLNCKYTIYTNPFPTVVVLIEHEDKVLLGKRNGQFGKGKWCIPGGYIEYNEDFISADTER
jgi:8-oxo-dGTP diphosphatase